MNKDNKSSFSEEEERRMRERSAVRSKERAEKQRVEQAKKEKRKKNAGKLGTALKISLIIIVVVSLLFIAARAFGNVTFTKIIDYIKDGFSNIEPGEGYPLEVGSGTVKDMLMIGDTTVVIRNDEIALLNKTAKKTSSYLHSYSKPMSSVSNGRLLVCDRVTGRYKVIDRSEILHETDLQTEVYACTMGKSGNYAFSTKASEASSMVSIYNSDFSKAFDFKCADEYIIGLSISPNGKNVALIGIGSKNASIYSKLYILNIKGKEIIATFDFDGESLNNVFYSGKNSVIVVGENSYTIITDNEKQEKVDFGYNSISRFAPDENGNFALVLSKYGSIDSGTVALLNNKGKEIFSVELDCKIECIDYDGSTVCVVDSDNNVHTFNKKGKLIGKTKLESVAQDITVNGDYCYALCYGTIVRLDVKTDL